MTLLDLLWLAKIATRIWNPKCLIECRQNIELMAEERLKNSEPREFSNNDAQEFFATQKYIEKMGGYGKLHQFLRTLDENGDLEPINQVGQKSE